MKTDLNKIVQIILYFLKKEGGKSNYTKIIKLIFLADKLHLKKYWRTISSDSYIAMKLWPVASSSLNIIKNFEVMFPDQKQIFEKINYDIFSDKNVDLEYFSESEIEVLEDIYKRFWNYDYTKLIDETHKFEEWKQFEESIKRWNVYTMDIEEFFDDSFGQNEIFNFPEEYINISKEIYQENYWKWLI